MSARHVAALGIQERGELLFGGAARRRVVSVKELSFGVFRGLVPINGKLILECLLFLSFHPLAFDSLLFCSPAFFVPRQPPQFAVL